MKNQQIFKNFVNIRRILALESLIFNFECFENFHILFYNVISENALDVMITQKLDTLGLN